MCALLLPADPPPDRSAIMSEQQFQERLGALERSPVPEQGREADALLRGRWLSSQQVKTAARAIEREDARLKFALAAYPRTVDPENFYEVYDAFTSFSTVFRLHDQIRQLRPPTMPPPAPVGAQPVTDEAFVDMLKALRNEAFEDSKKLLARQMLTGPPRFTSHQIRDLLKLFAFDDARLEVAKFAYDSVLDPQNYYLVNQAFNFSDQKEALARYIESRRTKRSSGPNR
jgi:hypothetical protein